jgi:hypothetical protein
MEDVQRIYNPELDEEQGPLARDMKNLQSTRPAPPGIIPSENTPPVKKGWLSYFGVGGKKSRKSRKSKKSRKSRKSRKTRRRRRRM